MMGRGNRSTRPSRLSVEPSTPKSNEFQFVYSPATSISSCMSSEVDTRCTSQVDPLFYSVVNHLQTPLCPLISSTTGLQHPEFPGTILAYHLLTSRQLDDLARHYHQIYPPVAATSYYPITIPPWVGASDESDVNLDTKRRRFGRFIGLRGCESPVQCDYNFDDDRMDTDPDVAIPCDPLPLPQCEPQQAAPPAEETEAEMLARMDREWQECLLHARQDSDAALRLKMNGF
ncbi:hypothetical protein P170DRAFT_429521 [Aspergillus steynii IBT 23096]|uniref:Uncharacterized protein n=1 Tax=Aspergillus steynii IBT 23096 TaxID=1392250 RepID=A0A2I2FVV7_9EURO|nr:uncharacterized protein P170DRAFT_429521 [Aspergillus steynii IBT 23096]PLB44770.1 hypothetical protein P170DRAFT_429521 [Aspergillus steynii IBT 23096]